MIVNVRIGAKGLGTVQNVLASMAARSVSMVPLMSRLGVALIGIVHTNFAEQGRPKWRPLSASTLRSYQEAAVQNMRGTQRYKNAKKASTRATYEQQTRGGLGGHKILMRTGELRNSIMLGEVTESSITIGSSLPYARIQQMGGTIGPITVRPKNAKALIIPTADGYILRRSADIPERKIPARPYLSIAAEDVPLLTGITMAYLREGRL